MEVFLHPAVMTLGAGFVSFLVSYGTTRTRMGVAENRIQELELSLSKKEDNDKEHRYETHDRLARLETKIDLLLANQVLVSREKEKE